MRWFSSALELACTLSCLPTMQARNLRLEYESDHKMVHGNMERAADSVVNKEQRVQGVGGLQSRTLHICFGSQLTRSCGRWMEPLQLYPCNRYNRNQPQEMKVWDQRYHRMIRGIRFSPGFIFRKPLILWPCPGTIERLFGWPQGLETTSKPNAKRRGDEITPHIFRCDAGVA